MVAGIYHVRRLEQRRLAMNRRRTPQGGTATMVLLPVDGRLFSTER